MKIETFMKKPLSERLQRSLDDLIYCEKNSKYRIDMNHWFSRKKDEETGKKFCVVCHAGACLARSINGPVTSQITVEHHVYPTSGGDARTGETLNSFFRGFEIGDGFGDFMDGVDALREGEWQYAAEYLNLPRTFFRGLGIRKMPDYDETPGKYKQAFRKIIRFVKAKEKKYAKMGKSIYRPVDSELYHTTGLGA